MRRFALLIVCGIASFAGPITLFSDFGPGDAFNCCAGYGTGGGAANSNAGFTVAAAFTPAVTATLDLVQVGVSVDATGNGSGDIVITLFRDSGGAPGSFIEAYILHNAATIAPSIVTAVSPDHVLLQAGTQYWIGVAPPDLINGKIGWLFNSAGATAPVVAIRNGSGSWGSTGTTQPAFRVTGDAVPEPATLLVCAAGLLAIAVRCRNGENSK